MSHRIKLHLSVKKLYEEKDKKNKKSVDNQFQTEYLLGEI